MIEKNNRTKPILDHLIQASIDHAHGRHDYSGRYEEITVPLHSRDDDYATEIKNALYRSARHLNVHLDLDVYRERIGMGDYVIAFTAVHPDYRKDYWHPLEVWKRQRHENKQRGYWY